VIIPLVFLVFLGILLVLATYAIINGMYWKSLKNFSNTNKTPKNTNPIKVSILVPARNEESNLAILLPTLLAQNYSNFEVLVLNDHSTDGTARVVDQLAARDSRLRLIEGAALPENWLGKSFACAQLAEQATGSIFIFTDADTQWQPQVVHEVVSAMSDLKADALSAWPQHPVHHLYGRLLQPLQQWSLMAFLPFPLVLNSPFPLAVAANGQMMAFRRKTYLAIGGHKQVRQEALEDMALARLVKCASGRFALLSGVGSLSCTMYQNNDEAWSGFLKNTYPAFGANPLAIILVALMFLTLYVGPWVLLIVFLVLSQELFVPFAAIAFSLLPRVFSDWKFGYPFGLFINHPVAIFLWVTLAFESWQRYASGQIPWKGRNYDLKRLRQPKNVAPKTKPQAPNNDNGLSKISVDTDEDGVSKS
jgi:chlorobactene glucosyltransferase